MADPHQFLKSATHALHERTEQAFAVFDLRSPDGYRGFLRAQAEALLPLEEAAAAGGVAALLPDWPSRRRGAAILADLARLGVPAPAPQAVSREALDPLGIAYVLEGSRHGARILLRRARAAPEPAIADATAFLGRPVSAAAWADFIDVLGRHRADPATWPALGAAAHFAFARFAEAALHLRASDHVPEGQKSTET